MNSTKSCPTCGSKVEVHTSDEGTSYYIPIVDPAPEEIEALERTEGRDGPVVGPLRCDKCHFLYRMVPLHGEGTPDPVCSKKPPGTLRRVT